MANRRERRLQDRQQRGGRQAKRPIIIGDGIVATPTDHQFEARPMGRLPDKVPGRHRWIATAAYVVDTHTAARFAGEDPDGVSYLDNESMFSLACGCWDCEQVVSDIDPKSPCPAGDSEVTG